MSSGTFYPGATADDGYWRGGNFHSVASTNLIGHTGWSCYAFMRFVGVTIPQGSTIDSAFVRITCSNTINPDTVNVKIQAEDVDDAVAPTSAAEGNALVLTSANINWNAIAHWTADVQYDTPDIKSVIQEIVDRGGWSSNNALQIIIGDNSSSSSAVRYWWDWTGSSGAKIVELHVTWTVPIAGEISENASVSSEFDDNFGETNENVNVNAEFIGLEQNSPISENISIDSEFRFLDQNSPISVEASVNSEFVAGYTSSISENASVNSAMDGLHQHLGILSEEVSVNSTFKGTAVFQKTIQETLSVWDTLKWGWQKTIADSMAITETASKILGIPVKDWLTITDTETNNWNGVESISDSLYVFDISKAVKVYEDLLADGMAITDAAKIALELIISDIFTCVDAIVDTGTFQHTIEDGMTLADIAKRFFPKSVSDSFAATDTSLVDFLALLQISDSFNATDTASRTLTINKVISDALEALDTVSVQQLIQELIQDGLNIEVFVEIDGEIWECWVLNTSSFHPSVYSNFEFNSYAIDRSNNICYGCKSDGIYTFEGSDDNGTPIRAGIILPDTQFGSAHNKRFRKAWLAVDGDNLILKAETETGNRTYRMTDTEISLTRDLKGRSWQFSVEGFNSLDSIDLVPIILSRK